MRMPVIPVPKGARAWAWRRFDGDPYALKFARRELTTLHAVVKACPQKRVAVQAGGNVGIFPKYLAQYFDEVLTFEPHPETFACLKRNVTEPNVLRLQMALGAASQSVGLSEARRHGRGADHSGLVHVQGVGDVPMIALDHFDLAICDLIYLDIEGYELYALHGARTTIQRCRPMIAIEVNHNLTCYGLQAHDVEAELEGLGYIEAARFKNDRLYRPRGAA